MTVKTYHTTKGTATEVKDLPREREATDSVKTYHTAKGTAKSKTSTETGAEPVTVKNYHTARDTASEVKDLPREKGGTSDRRKTL